LQWNIIAAMELNLEYLSRQQFPCPCHIFAYKIRLLSGKSNLTNLKSSGETPYEYFCVKELNL